MKFSEYKNTYYEHSGRASDVARTAAFAGIAIAWIFRTDPSSPLPRLPTQLLTPTFLFSLGLALDLFHYVVASILFYCFVTYEERKIDKIGEDPELEHPLWMTQILTCFFFAKLLFIMGAYIFLCLFLWGAWANAK
ncbi:MAG: hypothetical protein ACK5ZC_02865 [Pirellulaceae bacterium]|jgi:hypothetical protein